MILDERTKKLDGRRFSAADVKAAAGIPGHTLTNILSKSSLWLCSASRGKGRAREFCLIDVYQIALLARLTALCGSVDWPALALNHALKATDSPLNSEELGAWSDNDFKAKMLCKSICFAPKAYWHRGDTMYLVASFSMSWKRMGYFANTPEIGLSEILNKPHISFVESIDYSHFSYGVFISATPLFTRIDRELCNRISSVSNRSTSEIEDKSQT